MITSITQRIAQELSVHPNQVQAAVDLLDEGATVPFISRYRKEATGSLDDTQMRNLEERLRYLRELEDRRSAILKSVTDQGKLTPELEKDLLGADSKVRLEDLYLPYKPKRRTKAMIAREAGLEPLAEALLVNFMLVPEEAALAYVDAGKGVADVKAALEGARHILMEKFSEDAELIGRLREHLWDNAILKSAVVEGKETEGAKFRDYFDSREPLKRVPSHRALAQLRGSNEGFLFRTLVLEEDEQAQGRTGPPNRCEQMIARRFNIADQGRPADKWLNETVRWSWRVKIFLHLDLELINRLRETAETEAIHVFARNLHDLLLAAPAGPRTTIGLDPGLRSGVKIAVVDTTGKLVDFATIYPHEPKREWDKSVAVIAALATKHHAELISIGNGTASRETDKLATEVIKRFPELKLQKLVVSEAGASVYSASELAAREFPDVDVTIRGAVSIARRLQDPLAELVKIDPKAIGVGQYQHDVNQYELARGLDAVVEDCVNKVGVDVNTASAPLLARISGLNATLAGNIVSYRDEHGAFLNRTALKKVPRLGDKTFEQAAGFLRIMNGNNPLDASAVHPEAYPLVESIVARLNVSIKSLIGDSTTLRRLTPTEFTNDKFGLPTVKDILAELEKPGRDPRPEFRTAAFRDGVEELKDLQPGMILEGVVTNVANFGAFVDIGVHQDGLVHISALAEKFVKDPHTIVKAGDVVRVKVVEIDPVRRRIALTMRLSDEAAPAASTIRSEPARKPQAKRESPPQVGGAMAAALAKLRGG
ncbi:transcriptional accessory protein (plasmid) [Sulfuricella denitrificans skB26]|uniref:Transcriptional accessory protein n=1 Tax=Sulfuricella denitrificans (strain DSM 22764 / NBRC 105220 / skB26) TaxID=1163617 RepID=S6AE06_SULDS|nr:transcriptional accessory protein [Sulfuricella denitrificans skB26]